MNCQKILKTVETCKKNSNKSTNDSQWNFEKFWEEKLWKPFPAYEIFSTEENGLKSW